MIIRTPTKDMNERREMKVNLPVDLHLRLHAIKIRRGVRIADTVVAALEEYFDEQTVRARAPEPGAERA